MRAADPRLSIRVGAAVLLVALLGAAWFLYLRDHLFLGPAVSVRVSFQHVGNLREGAPVIVAGRQVGRITSIRLAPPGVEAIARIDARRARMVPENGDFFVASKGVLSERYLEVGPPRDGSAPGRAAYEGMQVRASDPASMDRVLNDAYANLRIARAFMDAVRPEAEALFAAIDELSATITALEPAPGEYARLRANLDHVVVEARTAWVTLEAGGARPEDLRALAARASQTFAHVRVATRLLSIRIDQLAADVERVRGRIDAVRPGLEARLRDGLDAARGALARIDAVNAKVQDLLGILERGEGTIGRLANDPEFPEDAKALGKILKRRPWRIFARPID